MKIITVSREFGSGGRELGKRLADILGYDYYDREIIASIAANKGMDKDFVENSLENFSWKSIPLTYGRSFIGAEAVYSIHAELLAEQNNVVKEIAKKGRDCLIVGRNANSILADYNPFNIFVCADMEARVKRCKAHEKGTDRNPDDLERSIRKIDKNRARTYAMVSDGNWGDPRCYNLTVNTSGKSIKALAQATAEFYKFQMDM